MNTQVAKNQPFSNIKSNNAIIIFIKNPVLGKVKTRLAASVGVEKALRIYEAMLENARLASLQIPATRYVYYSDFIPTADAWETTDFIKKIQQGGDLGERMSNAISGTLTLHEKAVLFGGDIPGLNAGIVNAALLALEEHDFVIGPALDGGYYLIGMKKSQPAVFQGIAWSSPQVFEQTMQAIQRLGASCYCLPPLSDIDYAEDWERFGWPLS
jgi:hypothetical protein